MVWRWIPDRAPDADVGLGKKFPTQGEAENWLGEFYPDLLEVGVQAVTLYEEDRLIYGPMRLQADAP
jgi:hypothetical protein